MIGAVAMASIRIGLVVVGTLAYWYMAFVGFMVVAVAADGAMVNKRGNGGCSNDARDGTTEG